MIIVVLFDFNNILDCPNLGSLFRKESVFNSSDGVSTDCGSYALNRSKFDDYYVSDKTLAVTFYRSPFSSMP